MKRVYQPRRKKMILIVDDDQIAIRMYQEEFQSQGFNVEVADNDHSAIQILRKVPVDLVLLDLCLPGMDVVEVLKNIRSEFKMEALPVIVLSNAYLGSLGRAALGAGATKCVTKVRDPSGEVLEMVCELLGVVRSNAPGTAAKVVVGNNDRTLALQFNAESREQLVATLLSNAVETLAKLRIGHQVFVRTEQDDLRRTELSKMHRQVRWLAASAGPLGFWKIAQVANALEALLIQLHARPKKIKPSVVRTIAQAIDTLTFLFDHATAPQTEELVPARILVVDDEIISRETICSALGQAGLPAVSLDDSLAARRLLEQEEFDLIFLDVEMPGESGLDLCVNIREMAKNRLTPVVFVTSHSDFGSRAQSTLSGGNDFIAKPFLMVELTLKALTWLFKEGPPPCSTGAAPDGASTETNRNELQSFSDHAVLTQSGEDTLGRGTRSCRAIEPEFRNVSSAV
jgi:CheY-like chemotaxis protein